MKTPFSTEVDIGAGHIVLDGFPALREKGTAPPLLGPCLLWPRSPISATAELLSKFVHRWKAYEICYKTIRHYPPHLRHVATLPCENKNLNFLQIFSRYGRKCKQIAFVHWFLGDRLPYVLSVLSVTFVRCGQTVGRIKMKLGMRLDLGPGHILLDRDPAPPPPKGHSPLLSPHICCGQMAA